MKKHKILIIEDDATILETLKGELETKNYLVDTAENGKIAIGLWEESIYDVILVDLVMPEMDGREVIHRIRERQPLTQIIIVSGQPKERDLIDAINLRVYAYLSKPTDLKIVLEKIEEGLWDRDALLLLLEKRAEEEPDEIVYIQGKEVMKVRQLYNEIRRGSPVGRQYWEEYRRNITEPSTPEIPVDELLGVKGVI